MELLGTEIIASFITLSFLEIVLGIDNLIFITLLVDTLPKKNRNKIRIFGLSLALLMRVAMLFSITWIMRLTEPLFTLSDHAFSVRDLLLLSGGIFLIGKATLEMHVDINGKENARKIVSKTGFWSGVIQIVIIDFIFSFDSILTAVGLSQHLPVMIAAVVVAMIVMLFAAGYLSKFLRDYPTFKMLALAFILMIGMLLTAEGMGVHVPKSYIYFAFGFSMSVEALNTLARKKQKSESKGQELEDRGQIT